MATAADRPAPARSRIVVLGTALSWAVAAAAAERSWIRLSGESMVVVGSFIAIASIVMQGVAVLLPYPALAIYVATLIGGTGMGLVFPTLSILTLRLSQPDEQGVNSSSIQIADGFGGILMTGIAGAAFHVLRGPQGTNGPLYVLMFGMMAAAAVAGALIAPRVREGRLALPQASRLRNSISAAASRTAV